MESFNDYFSYLITHCRDDSLEELRSNTEYIGLKDKHDDLRVRLEAAVSPEARELLDMLVEAATSVKSMECNKALLCGLTMSAEIKKRFDTSTDEYKAFEKEYL